MKRARITADAVLKIVLSIFEDEEINAVITDKSAPPNWVGKTPFDILNVEYYTFKHRPISTDALFENIAKEERQMDKFAALNRSFCFLSLGDVERLYSKDVDTAALSVKLEYYVQTSKVKLLEYLVEDCNLALCGLRIPVVFGAETRKAVIMLDPINLLEIKNATPFGEIAHVDIDIDILFYPDVVSYSDYTVNVAFDDNGVRKNADVPLSSFSFVDGMTQDAVPKINDRRKVGSINLSCATSFVMVFDGYNNEFINYITDKALDPDSAKDNNQPYVLTVTRGDKSYVHEVVIKDHQTTVRPDTDNETHTLTFVARGMNDGN